MPTSVDALPGLPPALARRAEAAARWLDERRPAGQTVTVVHHIDADGVTSGAVALKALERAGIPSRSVAAKSLDDVHVAAVQDGGHEALWFCDFGSTAYMHFDAPKLVCDHHELVRDGTEEDFPHVNPLLDGLPGDSVSGAGCALLVALAHDPRNLDLLPTALVGAAADLQDRWRPSRGPPARPSDAVAREGERPANGPSGGPGGEAARDRHGGFSGTNAVLVAAGRAAGLLEVETDLGWFGPETRPLTRFLSYASEPCVPTVTGDRRTAEALLRDLGVPLEDGDGERTWGRLTPDERRRVRSAVVDRWLDCGATAEDVDGLWRPVVRIAAEAPGTPVRELREFGTLLNSTARYGEPEVGLRVAAGDRGDAYQEALGLLTGHRRHLASSVSAFVDAGVREESAIQWTHVRDGVRDTVVGIVCGMALGGLGLRRDMPLVAFAHTGDGRTKVSSRAPNEIQGRVDLATAMREGSAAVGGQGGGHRAAAGATIPRGSEEEFVRVVDAIVAAQLGVRVAGPPPEPSLPPASAAPPPPGAPTAPPVPTASATPATSKAPPVPASWAQRPGQSTLF